MSFIVCCMKSDVSYARIKMQFQNQFTWENFIQDIEEIQQNIVFKEYDLAIVDEKLWWKDEVVELLERRNIKTIIFQGDFEEIERQLAELLPKEEIEEEIKVEPKEEIEDKREIRYIEKIKTIEKEVTVRVPVYKSVYTGLKSNLIGVISLSERSGASFITLNLAKALSEYNVLTSIIEVPIKAPYIFDTVGLEQRLDKISEEESLNFVSYPHLINDGEKIPRDKETIDDGIVWLVPDPRKARIINWDYTKMMKLIYTSKKASITFVDCGNAFNHESINPILSEMDMILVVVDPLPTEVMQNQDKLDKLIELKKEGINVEFILNKWNSGVDKKKLLNFMAIEPLMYVPYIEPSLIYKAIYECKIPYSESEVKEKLEKPFAHIIKKVVPTELIKSNNSKESVSKSNWLSKLKLGKGK